MSQPPPLFFLTSFGVSWRFPDKSQEEWKTNLSCSVRELCSSCSRLSWGAMSGYSITLSWRVWALRIAVMSLCCPFLGLPPWLQLCREFHGYAAEVREAQPQAGMAHWEVAVSSVLLDPCPALLPILMCSLFQLYLWSCSVLLSPFSGSMLVFKIPSLSLGQLFFSLVALWILVRTDPTTKTISWTRITPLIENIWNFICSLRPFYSVPTLFPKVEHLVNWPLAFWLICLGSPFSLVQLAALFSPQYGLKFMYVCTNLLLWLLYI